MSRRKRKTYDPSPKCWQYWMRNMNEDTKKKA